MGACSHGVARQSSGGERLELSSRAVGSGSTQREGGAEMATEAASGVAKERSAGVANVCPPFLFISTAEASECWSLSGSGIPVPEAVELRIIAPSVVGRDAVCTWLRASHPVARGV